MSPRSATCWLSCALAALLFATAAVVTGCGTDDGAGDRGPAQAGSGPGDSGFPRPSSRSLRELIRGLPQGPELVPSVSVVEPGLNRFGFALFDRAARQIGGLDVALYVSQGVDETAYAQNRRDEFEIVAGGDNLQLPQS